MYFLFFSIHCTFHIILKFSKHYVLNIVPAATSEPQTPAQPIDYNFAREELMLNELNNGPIQSAIARLERQHEEDKQGINFLLSLKSSCL